MRTTPIADAKKTAWIDRVSPALPVRPSASDADAIRRFPRGYPHIVALTDEGGAISYAVRLRTISGRLDLIGETTVDLSEARDSLRNVHGDLFEAMRYNTTQELEDAVEAAFLRDWWPNGREADPMIDSRSASSGWPRMHHPHFDEELLNDIPAYFPIVLSMDRNDQRYYTHAFKDTTGYLCWPGPMVKRTTQLRTLHRACGHVAGRTVGGDQFNPLASSAVLPVELSVAGCGETAF